METSGAVQPYEVQQSFRNNASDIDAGNFKVASSRDVSFSAFIFLANNQTRAASGRQWRSCPPTSDAGYPTMT